MNNLKLRPYQIECLQIIKEKYQNGVTRQLIHLPTGAGKTVIFAHLIQQTGLKTLVIAHTSELLEQAKDKIEMICPSLKVGLVNGQQKEFCHPVIVSSIQSARQPETLRQLQQQGFDLLVYDESHRSSCDSARMVIDALGFGKGTKKLLTGFTATPSREDGRGLGEDFDEIVFSKSIKSMIQEGYLCPPIGIKIATDLDLSNVQSDNGDYSAVSLSKMMDTEQINDLIAKTYLEKAAGRKALCFGVSILHAENLANRFKTHGVRAETINGNMAIDDRENVLKLFKNGEIDVLTNCMVLTEGFDCPSVDAVIIARPTKSKGLYQQMAGRGLRLYPNKSDCLILDFGDKNHTLCSSVILVGDAEVTPKECQNNTKMTLLADTLPPSINQKLKSAILTFDLLGDSFFWQKEATGYNLKGTGYKNLKIFSSDNERFDVIFIDGKNESIIAQSLSFEYAFSTAEEYAKTNRSHFILSDLEAPWRKDPISERQKALFRSGGFKRGIEDLTKGQAATIISSGILKRNAAKMVSRRH